MKKIILTISIMLAAIYSSIATADTEATTPRSGTCNVSMERVGRIFGISLGEYSYVVTSSNPALECENLALLLGKRKQAEPENINSVIALRYSFSASIKLTPEQSPELIPPTINR